METGPLRPAGAIDRAEAPAARPAFRFPGGFPAALLLVWIVCASLFCLADAVEIAHFNMLDPDDWMRLLEVRDWLGGQSWFDVTQYRLNQPDGFAMHWSRLVDVPIGATILLLRPFFGNYIAELTASAFVPMLTLGCAMVLVALITRRTVGERAALMAAAFCTISMGTFYAMRPMRIDHHGWQIVAGLGIVHALTGIRTTRRAAIAGLWAALWMDISIEGIVFVAAAAAWLGLRWLVVPEREGARLPAYLGAMTAASLGLSLLIHGGALFDRTYCDAVSPVHIVLFGIAALVTAAATWRAPATRVERTAWLAVGAIAAAATYRLWAPQCLHGPFNTLDSLTYNLWYKSVAEGMPLWDKPVGEFFMWVLYPFVGLVGAALCLWGERDEGKRADALDYGAMLAAASLVGVTVMRAGAFSNMLAIPGGVVVLVAALKRAEAAKFLPLRVIGLSAPLLLLNPVSPGLALAGANDEPSSAKSPPALTVEQKAICSSIDNLAHLNALPPATIMAPMYLTPPILVATHHAGVGAGYHRNPQVMADMLGFFTGDDATARAIARRRNVRWLVLCADAKELDGMRHYAPNGLAARLATGSAPGWLRPVTVPGLRFTTVYAVNR